MKNNHVFIALFLLISLSLIFISCNKNDENTSPIESNSDSFQHRKSLSKSGWVESGQETWPTEVKNISCLYVGHNHTAVLSQHSYSLSFMSNNYNFIFDVSRPNADAIISYTFSCYVNGVGVRQVTWSAFNAAYDHPQGWSSWYDFNYNGVNMSVRYNLDITTYSNCTRSFVENRVRNVQVRVWGKVSPDPITGLAVSPSVHNSTSRQSITISWNVSSDPDVTGYNIYRSCAYPTGGTSFVYGPRTLITTISSRTTNSHVDGGVDWSRYKAAAYSVETVAGSLRSASSPTVHSYVQGYDYMVP